MQNFINKTDCLEAITTFALNCALPVVHCVGVDNKIHLVACEIGIQDKVKAVLRTRGLKRICFRVMDRLDSDREETFTFTAKGFLKMQ